MQAPLPARPNLPVQSRLLPYIALVVGVLGMGMSAIFIRWANAPGPVNGLYRMLFAVLILALPVARSARRESPVSIRHAMLAALGGLFFAGDLVFWNTSVLLTSAANATLIGNSSVLWVTLGALILFKEKLHSGFWVGLLCALSGIGIIFGQDLLTHPVLGLGDFYALCGGFFYGMFFLAAERSRDKLSAILAWGISSVVSAFGLWLLCLAFGFSLTDYPAATWLNILALALSTQVIGLLSVNYALGHLPASLVSPSLLGQPIVTAILAVPLLAQPLTLLQIFGGLLALAGILIVHRSKA